MLDGLGFVRPGFLNVDGDGKAFLTGQRHNLAPLSPLGFADARAPFLAARNIASMKVSANPIFPWVRNSSARAITTPCNTPWSTHRWNQRWQVWYGGYAGRGRSFQRAPLTKTHKMPSKIRRGSLHGRPRPSARRGGAGINDSNFFHCSSVNLIVSTPARTTLNVCFRRPTPSIVNKDFIHDKRL
jgi:hypothetical protein